MPAVPFTTRRRVRSNAVHIPEQGQLPGLKNTRKSDTIKSMAASRQAILTGVLTYLENQPEPVRLNTIAADLRKNADMHSVRVSEIRDVVQSMIISGQLGYATGLRIERK